MIGNNNIIQTDESFGADGFPGPHQMKRLGALIDHAYHQCTPMREKMDRAGIMPEHIRKYEDLIKIPITSKEEHLELQKKYPPSGGLLTIPLNRLHRIGIHPGPIYDWHTPTAYQACLKFVKSTGFGKEDIVAVTMDYHLMGAGAVFDQTLTDLEATVIPVGPGNKEIIVRALKELGVTGYVGTASFLHAVLNLAEDSGFQVQKDFSLRLALLGAEPVPPSLRQRFEEHYGIETRQGYGTSEVSVVAWECSEKSGMHFSVDAIIEIVDPETGIQLGPESEGEIVVTPLDMDRPLIRFGTGDIGSFTMAPCPCGNLFPRLVGISGRLGEAYKIRGRFLHLREVEAFFHEFQEIQTYQIVLERMDHKDSLCLKLIPTPSGFSRSDLDDVIKKRFKDTLGIRPDQVKWLNKRLQSREYSEILDLRKWE